MSQNNGYIIIIDEPDRSEKILEDIGLGRDFSDALSVPDWKIKDHEICILSFDGKNLTHAAIAERGGSVASYKYKIKFKYIASFFPPLSIKEITDQMGNKLRKYFVYASSGKGGRVPSKTWDEFISILMSARPDIFEEIEKLQRLKHQDNSIYDRKASEILAQEKDTISLSLSIFDIDRSNILPYWTFNKEDGDVAPFLKGLQGAKLLEDTMITNDSKIFGDWEFIKNLPVTAAAMFRKNNEMLTILNVNRTSIEKTLGVDLIYYHHVYDSFVLVQYKRMMPLNEEKSEFIYRPQNDKSYKIEIKRMEEFEAKYMNAKNESSLKGFRLHDMPFFFKICKPFLLNPLSSDMIKGMYIPLTYWRILLKSDAVKGPKGGINVSYDTTERWIDNTHFIKLVQEGWIGSCPEVSKNIAEIIHKLLENDHSITLAFSSDKQ